MPVARLVTALTVCLIFSAGQGLAQKKPVDLESLDRWEWFTERRISNNGEWISFGVAPAGGAATLYLVSSRRGKKLSFPQGRRGSFTGDSRRFYCYLPGADRSRGDSLVIVDLASLHTTALSGVKEFRIADRQPLTYAYTRLSASGEPVLQFMTGTTPDAVPQVVQFLLSPDGRELVYEQRVANRSAVIWRSLETQKSDTVAAALEGAGKLQLDPANRALAFAWKDSSGAGISVIHKNGKRLLLREEAVVAMAPGYTIALQEGLQFSASGDRLLFSAHYPKPAVPGKPGEAAARLELWSHTDDYIQPVQKKILPRELSKAYRFLWHLGEGGVVQLSDVQLDELQLGHTKDETHGLLLTSIPYRSRVEWDPDIRYDAYAVELRTGKRKPVTRNRAGVFQLSPGGRFVVWFDREKQHYYSYEMATGLTRPIDAGVTDTLGDHKPVLPKGADPFGIALWEEGDRSLLVNTARDVWQLDPLARQKPVNLTGGLARREQLQLGYYAAFREAPAFQSGDTLLFFGLNHRDKHSGFFAVPAGGRGKPQRLLFGPYGFTFPGMAIARDSRHFLLSYGSTDHYGLFHSANLQQFDTVYLLNPHQKAYNWYRSELVRWNTGDGKSAEGVLYKPENFSPGKKYPMIVWVYENDDARNLYAYRIPKWSGSIIDWTYYTSNGYLVFVPDIQYTIGRPGESAYRTIMSGIRHLEQRPWVDTARLGLQGHSWGGYQVAYLVSRTNKFKAAQAGALVSNLVSAYGSLRSNEGQSRYWVYERHWGRIGATLWQKPEAYIENSPLFRADRITTPLLMTHNQNDGVVPFGQSVELYLALKRLGKRAWLLNYTDENHIINNPLNKKDFTVRLLQFFDHYLKGAEAPDWMIRGLPAIAQRY